MSAEAEAEVDVGFLVGQGEVVGMENEGQGTRGWSTQRGWWPSPLVECTRNGKYNQGQDRRGKWQAKVVG